MEKEFWIGKWDKNQIGFHRDEINPMLIDHWDKLNLATGSRVFVPLCGKTNDIAWLLSKGYKVVGVELSQIAIDELFQSLAVTPKIETIQSGLLKYSVDELVIFVGDFFLLNKSLIGNIDAVYDRAALVALPEEMRTRYAQQLIEISDAAPQFLITLSYDQGLMSGPPFSITEGMIRQYYESSYSIRQVDIDYPTEVFKGNIELAEALYLLS